ncbi:MAG TPA: patatin [Firmicutes bacterium]|nr:patatin [Bacillota bacterium]
MKKNRSGGKKNMKIGLALGSGGARGWAHIGVLRALAESDIPVHCIGGTSMGALVGSLFAAGKLDALEQAALKLDWKQLLFFFDAVFPHSGLIDGAKVAGFIRDQVESTEISDLSIPFSAVATNLIKGQQVILKEGDLIEAIRATISIPGIFTPLKIGDDLLVDGALVNPVPVDVVRDMGADYVVAVEVNYLSLEHGARSYVLSEPLPSPEKRKKKKSTAEKPAFLANLEALRKSRSKLIKRWEKREVLPNIFEVLTISLTVMEVQITERNLELFPPDLLIRPEVGDIGFLEFDRAQEAINKGYESVMEKAGEIKKALKLK